MNSDDIYHYFLFIAMVSSVRFLKPGCFAWHPFIVITFRK